MATLNSTPVYPGSESEMRSMKMRRTAPPGSRIPVAQPGQKQTYMYNRYQVQSAPTAQPSRLEMMQNEYQKRLLKEKEQKMINMYEQNQQQALRKVSGKERNGNGMVRDFFRERRALEQSGQQLPSMDAHFKQKKKQHEKMVEMEEVKHQQMMEYHRKPALQQETQYRQQQQQYQQQQYLKQQQNHHPKQKQQKPTRSNPLAPIRQDSYTNKNYHRPPSPDGLYETTDNFPVVDDTDGETGSEASPHLMGKNGKPVRAPARQPLKPILSKAKSEQGIDLGDQRKQKPTTLRNRTATTHAQRKVLVVQRKTTSQPNLKEEKLSDFQKWQMEQDQQRKERLEKHREKQKSTYPEADSSFEYDRERHEQKAAHHRRQKEYDDIKKKEAELEAIIAKHQADLQRIQCVDEELDNSEAQTQQSHRQIPKNSTLTRQNHIDYPSPHQERFSVMSQSPANTSQPTARTPESEEPVEMFSKKPLKGPQRKPVERNAPAKQHQPQKRKPQAAPRMPSPPPLNAEVSFYEERAKNSEPTPNVLLKGCPNCGRQFAADRIAKHVNICKKAETAAKKRKTYDMTKKRTEGTEMAAYVKRGEHLKEKIPAKKSNWKKKHEEFMRTVENARKTQAYINKGGNLADLPPPPPSENPDYKQCPWCSRKFNPATAERHIPKCKDIKSRPRPPKKR